MIPELSVYSVVSGVNAGSEQKGGIRDEKENSNLENLGDHCISGLSRELGSACSSTGCVLAN